MSTDGALPEDCPGLDGCWPAQPIQERLDRLESSIRVVAAGHVALTEQMAELSISSARQDKRLNQFASELTDNSRATRETLQAALEIKDIVTTGRTMGKLARWAAPTFIAFAVALGVMKGWVTDAAATAAELMQGRGK